METTAAEIAEFAPELAGDHRLVAAVSRIVSAIEPSMEERIAARIAELKAKPRLTKSERQELEQLTYSGPAPRVLPRTEEWPF